MAYTKLTKITADLALGYQGVNKLRDNFEAHYAAWSLRHGESEVQSAAPNLFMGHHNDDKIPRDVIGVTVSYVGQFVAPLLSTTGGNFVRNPVRLSTGVYQFPIIGLSTFWGEVISQASSVTPVNYAKAVSYYSGIVAGQQSSIIVSTNVISGGTFTPTDMNFTLTIYGTI